MKSHRIIVLVVSALVLVAAAAAAALYLTSRRDVTTSSSAAARAYREGMENEQRFYFKEARVNFAKALELDPDFAMAMLALARNSERDQAHSMIEHARQLRGHLTERERLHVDMQYAFLKGNADEGFRIAHTIHQKFPDDARAVALLAGEENLKGNTQRASEIFTELLAIDPNNAAAYNQLGYSFAFRGDYNKSIENFKKYQFLAPDQANPFDSMGEVQAFSGRYDEAVANLKHALAIKPDFYASYDHLGVVYEGKGDWDQAISSYEKAADNTISDGIRAGYLAKALRVAFLSGQREATAAIAAKLQALPKNEFSELREFYVKVGRDLMEGHPEAAEKTLRDIKPKLFAVLAKNELGSKYKPYDAGWDYLMAYALRAQGKDAEAIVVYEEMANPPNPWSDFESRRWVFEGRAELAALLARKGDLDRAESLLAENRKWNPSWAPSLRAEQTVAQLRHQKVLAAAK